jgi:glycosyltransferase involved in cell wall biosynthesis
MIRVIKANESSPTLGKPLQVLYLHHVGVRGGSSKSLILLLEELAGREVLPHLIVQRGPVAEQLTSRGYPCIPVRGISLFDNSALSAYRGLRWLVLGRELVLLPTTLRAILRAKRQWPAIDLIHANEWSLLPAALVAKLVFRRPVILHARSLQSMQVNYRRRLLLWLANKFVEQTIAIDSAVGRSIGSESSVQVIHNGDRMQEWKPEWDNLGEGELRIGIVANFLAYKGVEDFIEAARICLQDFSMSEAKFLIFGDSQRRTRGVVAGVLETLGVRHDSKSESVERVLRYRIGDRVSFEGFVASADLIYPAIDVLCFPSRLDAVGRPVFEAACYGRPSIVALRTRRRDDSVIDGITGLIVPERDPNALAQAMRAFYENRASVSIMGASAYRLTRDQHDIRTNAGKVLKLYGKLALVRR